MNASTSSTPSSIRVEARTDSTEPAAVPLAPHSWPLLMARAILSLLLGMAALAWPAAALGALALVVAAFLLVHGVLAFACGIREALHHRRSGTVIFEGVVGIVAGLVAFAWPLGTLLALIWLAAAWALLSGASLVATAVRRKPYRGRVLLGLGGLMSIAWGFLIVVAPAVGAVAVAVWLGAFALLFGVVLFAAALGLRRDAQAEIGRVAPA
jgi:uncharacterized membrane protein HdeD (DUF308 family)